MTDEGEVEIIDADEHSTLPQNHNSLRDTDALVEVVFQKNPNQEQKFLEAEPKALGLTQIMLSFFFMSTKDIPIDLHYDFWITKVVISILSLVGIIAGFVAIASQSLHLPKIKACLGMQIVSCVLSAVCFIVSGISTTRIFDQCWEFHYKNETKELQLCETMVNVSMHLSALDMLWSIAQVTVSATLAAYCCKVIQCCSPRTSVPMIVVNAPAAPQRP